MTTDGFRTPPPPDVLLAAYDVGPGIAGPRGSDSSERSESEGGRVGAANSGSRAQRVTGLVAVDGLACATVARTPAGRGRSAELLIVASSTASVARRVPLRSAPVGLAAVSTDGGGRLFLLAAGGGAVVPIAVVPIDVRRDGDHSPPGAAIRLGPAPDASAGVRASRREHVAPSVTASDTLRRVYVGDPRSRRILVIDADRILPLPDETIELPAAPGRLVVDDQDGTLLAGLAGCRRPELAVVDPITGAVETLDLPAGVEPRDICYDYASGLIFVGTGAAGWTPPGVLVLDRDTGCAVGEPIRTGGVPTALTLLRAAGATLLFCTTTHHHHRHHPYDHRRRHQPVHC